MNMSKNNLFLNQKEIQQIEQFRQSNKTAVLTILFTDIVGFTKFTEDAGEKISTEFRHIHDELFTKTITRDGAGEIIKHIGDSFLAIFAEPSIAVTRALEFQQSLSENRDNLTHNRYTIRVRIGIHLGQVSLEDTIHPDIFGGQVNKTSRIMSVARGGQVIVSDTVKESAITWIRNSEKETIGVQGLGKIKLKGIKEKTGISQVYVKGKKLKKPKIVKVRNRKRIATMILFLIGFFYFNNKSTQRYDKVVIDVIYNDSKTLKYFEERSNTFSDDSVKFELLPDSLIKDINKQLYSEIVRKLHRKDLNVLSNEDLQNNYGISLTDSVKKYIIPSEEYLGLHPLIPSLSKKIESNIILYWLYSDSKQTIAIWENYWEEGRFLYSNGRSSVSRKDLFKELDVMLDIDKETLTRERNFNLIDFIQMMYNEIILDRADWWYGDGFIKEIFDDKYRIKLLNTYNIKAGMEVSVQKVWQLNKELERERYVQYLNYNIMYLDSISGNKPKKWKKVLRGNKNSLNDYNEEKYINVGNQFLSTAGYNGEIILRIDEIIDEYAIATLVKKEYPWITIEKKDRIFFRHTLEH